MAKKPNYGARRTAVGTVAGGLAGAAGAAIAPAARLAAAGLESGPAAIAGHIVGSGMIGAAALGGGIAAYHGVKAIKNAIGRNSHFGDGHDNAKR